VTAIMPLIVGIGGSAGPGSLSEAALRYCLAAASDAGARTRVFAGADLDVPLYAPGTPRDPRVRALLAAVQAANGVVIASPAYHGTMSGRVKNALDYLEDLRDACPCYLDGRPVGVIASGAGPTAAAHTIATLRGVAHALRGWPTPLGVAIDSAAVTVSPQGQATFDDKTAGQLTQMGRQIVDCATAFAAGAAESARLVVA
jgi:FMN reductase